jgi:hypothetical protein
VTDDRSRGNGRFGEESMESEVLVLQFFQIYGYGAVRRRGSSAQEEQQKRKKERGSETSKQGYHDTSKYARLSIFTAQIF